MTVGGAHLAPERSHFRAVVEGAICHKCFGTMAPFGARYTRATLVCYTLPRGRCLKSPELPREVCGICYKCFDTLLVFFHRDRLERLAGGSGLLADACGVRVPL